MVDRLYENMLGLIRDSQEQYCNSTLCNLNSGVTQVERRAVIIVIVHYVI